MPAFAHRLRVAALLAVAVLSPLTAESQVSAADSVRAFEALPETAQVLVLNAQAWALRRSDPTLAIAIAKRSLETSRRIGFGRAEAQVLNYLGVGYQWLGDNRQAQGHFFEALAAADSAGAAEERGYALNNIAALLLSEGEGEQALGYAQQALDQFEAIAHIRGIGYAQIRLSETNNFLGRYDQAIVHAGVALRIWNQMGEATIGLTARRNEAIAYEGKQQYATALAKLIEIDASDSLPDITRLRNFTDLARLYLRLGQYDKAIEVGLEKLRRGETDAEILGHLSEAYARRRDWATAYAYAKRETAVRDSVAKQERFKQLKDLQLDYETTKKEEENAALRDGLRLTRYLAASIGAILLLSAFLVASLFSHRRRQDRVNRTLAEQLARIRASEAALSESSRLQRAILDNVPDAMWVKDVDGRYTAVNAAFAARFNRPQSEIEGLTAADIFSPATASALERQEQRVIASRQAVREEHDVVVGGAARVVEKTLSPVLDASDAVVGTTGISRDITDRRRVEAQVRHAQKLESLSVLAGGIAHDFNNLLVGIIGNTELARFDLEPTHPVRESLDHIEAAAHRAAELTRQMLDYTGKSQIDMRELDLSAVVGRIAADLGGLVPGSAELRFDLESHLPRVRADAAQVAQLVMSLVGNAADALTDGAGTITVRTARVQVAADGARTLAMPDVHEAHEALNEGEYVVIEVADTGHGMSAETRRRIFEPFFTTRFLGRGLSLAAVQGILRGHRGTIEVTSEEGRGSCFRAYFPAVVTPAIVAPALPGPPPAADIANEPGPDRSERARQLVLVVDDDATVRSFAGRVLERAGFSVVTAEDGEEGIAMVERHRSELSAVLLDVMMPRLGGREAKTAMRRLAPDLPIVFMSGFTGETAAQELCQGDFVAFLPKPFPADALPQMLREQIDAREERMAGAR